VKDFALAEEISNEVEWRGPFLKKVREARRISIEELSKITKISKTYLSAIEEELFEKLPAPVFTRGFVTQFAKTLKLNHVPVVAAYMTRFQQAKADKNGP
jgi:flagellar biosynthesis protein FlhG